MHPGLRSGCCLTRQMPRRRRPSSVWRRAERSCPGSGILEIRNVLIVAERRGRIAAEHTQRAVRALNRLPILTDPAPNLDMAFYLARAHGLTFYDGLYLELAVRRRTALATLDHRLGRAAAEGLPAV